MINNDLVEVVKLGDTRERTVTLDPGEHAIDAETVARVKTKIDVKIIERYAYKYPGLKECIGWQFVRYEWDTARPTGTPPATEPGRLPWWRRLFKKSRIPEARLLSEGK